MARGSRPGERRGGRKAGTPNKATADVRDAAREYTAEALKTLATVMGGDEQPAAARVSAAIALLDRAHGKPTQSVEASGPNGKPLGDQVGVLAHLPRDKRDLLRAAIREALGAA